MKLSVIIPVYNTARYLCECLDSVAAQSFADWECICVDDGSTDDSGAILDEYAAQDFRFKVIHQANGGVSSARNAALEVAHGEWVAFVDSDDTIAPEWLAEAVALMSNDVDFVRLALAGSADGKVAPTSVLRGRDAARWTWGAISGCGYLCLCFVRRACIGNVRFRLGFSFEEDMLFLLEITPALRGAVQGGFAGYNYRQVVTSATRKARPVAERVAFMNVCQDVWRAQRAWAEKMEVVEFVRERWRLIADTEILQWMERPGAGDPSELRRAYRALEREGMLSPEFYERRLVLVWRWTRCFWFYRLAQSIVRIGTKMKIWYNTRHE